MAQIKGAAAETSHEKLALQHISSRYTFFPFSGCGGSVFWVPGSRFKVQGLGFRFKGSGLRLQLKFDVAHSSSM